MFALERHVTPVIHYLILRCHNSKDEDEVVDGGRAQPAERTHYFPASTRGEREQTKREVYLSCADNWVAERDSEVVRLLGSPIRKSAALRSCHQHPTDSELEVLWSVMTHVLRGDTRSDQALT